MQYTLGLGAISLALAGGCTGKSPDVESREALLSGYATVLKSWDKNGDERLSRTEIAAMVDEFFSRVAQDAPQGKMTTDLERQRQGIIAFYASQDTDEDGHLTLSELLKGPLDTFDCMNTNRDGKLSEDEVFSGMTRCPSVDLEAYASRR